MALIESLSLGLICLEGPASHNFGTSQKASFSRGHVERLGLEATSYLLIGPSRSPSYHRCRTSQCRTGGQARIKTLSKSKQINKPVSLIHPTVARDNGKVDQKANNPSEDYLHGEEVLSVDEKMKEGALLGAFGHFEMAVVSLALEHCYCFGCRLVLILIRRFGGYGRTSYCWLTEADYTGRHY